MGSVVKEEIAEAEQPLGPAAGPGLPLDLAVIDLSSSDDDEGVCMAPEKKPRALDGAAAGGPLKKRKSEDGAALFLLPLGFLDPLPREDARPAPPPPLPRPPPLPVPQPISVVRPLAPAVKVCRQFWKAGDYEGDAMVESASLPAGIDHVRVHPKFLHSNATSHKWALGAIAELLDNAVDEVCNGATFVNVDVLENRKDMTKMLLVEDNGGGMDPDRVRQCMSLGYSVKSKSANTIGQYGNGFKTSTMRLGADVVVFSRCRGKGGKSSMQSIGLLSYTFLRDTGKEDIMVPMLDYEKGRENWNKLVRTSTDDWNKNLETIVQWSPFSSEDDLLQQFGSMTDQGTRIVIYNLWEDDQGLLELDFGTDRHDIQVRGVNRDEKKIQMAKQFPNSRHFLTYQHSLRSYASILYLRLPQDFRIILRGKEVEHHDIVDDMMHKQEVTYKPQNTSDGIPRDPNMVAVVRIGFVKDAKDHIDIQGFNVYHKNRLIKPFWRVWNASGSGGRGVLGVLEANFVEPAHDKQGFERTTVLARLEARLVQMQKSYWGKHSHMVGYRQQTRKNPSKDVSDKETSPEAVLQQLPGFSKNETQFQRSTEKRSWSPVECSRMKDGKYVNGRITSARENEMESGEISAKKLDNSPGTHRQPYPGNQGDFDSEFVTNRQSLNASSDSRTSASSGQAGSRSNSKETGVTCNQNEHKLQNTDVVSFEQLKKENRELKERLKKMEDEKKLLSEKREEAERKLEEANKEQEALIDIFSEERKRRDMEEENLRKRLKDASATIQQLLDRLSCNRNNAKN